MAFLITNVRIFDGISVISECGHVLLDQGRIAKISAKDPIQPPQSCTVIDGSSSTLLPGLIDAHVHVFRDLALLEAAIQHGVTTVLDMHNEPYWFQEMKQLADQRNNVADVHSACHAATIRNGWPSPIVRLVSQEENVRSECR
jgi:dihydroorotase-like cyclic amidohydrolase